MADDEGRRAELVTAGLTLLLAAMLAFVAVSVLRGTRPRTPCGCQDKEAADGDA